MFWLQVDVVFGSVVSAIRVSSPTSQSNTAGLVSTSYHRLFIYSISLSYHLLVLSVLCVCRLYVLYLTIFYSDKRCFVINVQVVFVVYPRPARWEVYNAKTRKDKLPAQRCVYLCLLLVEQGVFVCASCLRWVLYRF